MTRRAFAMLSMAAMGARPASLTARASAVGPQAPSSPPQDEGLRSEFLLDLVVTTGAASDVGSPGASRAVIPVTGGTFDGPNLRGTVIPPGGDWTARRQDGSLGLDVRLMLQTDDGQKIGAEWRGVYYAPPGAAEYARILPMFETGAAKYAWLNHIVTVGVHRPMPGKVAYRIYRIL